MQDNQNSNNRDINESTDTRNFEPVSTNSGANTGTDTKTFDAVNGKNEKQKKESKQGGERQSSKTSRAAKATASGVLFVFRKVLTYLLNILLTVLVIGIITGAVVALAFVVYIKNYVDPNYTGLDNLRFDSALSTTMYYVNDAGEEVLLEGDTLSSSENRLWAKYSEIPKQLIDAYIAVEDQRFYDHNGVDTTRTASAIYNFFIPTSSNYGGGSTITQQLIKNASGENDATIQRKVQEIFRAINVEEKYTKEEILEMYLNTIYLSHNSYGVRVAAKTYFGKELDELTLAECASIASIGKWPTHYDPLSNPKNNLTRRNLVLKLMLEQEKITQEQFDEAYDAPITLAEGDEEIDVNSVHSYYIDAVMDDVVADLMEKYDYDKVTASQVLFSGGLQIVTCLDPVIQSCAEKVFTDSSYWPQTPGMQAQAAITIMDPKTGDLLAIVGGLGEKRDNRGFNRATQAYRQCGSSIKPVAIYALALDSGYMTGISPVDDVPPILNASGVYWPTNANGRFLGLISPDYAIQASLNTVVVRLCEDMGVETVYNNFKDYGYTTLVDSKTTANGTVVSDINSAPLALGGLTYGITVREHTQAYATLANKGVTSKARTYSVVRDSSGKIILDNSEEHRVKYSESTTAVLTDLLTHVVGGPYGTGGSVGFWRKYGVQCAGKTGTTNDNRDVYFAGYTPDLVACCWYGYDLKAVIPAAGNAAPRLWNSVFDEIYKYYDEHNIEYTKNFDVPSSVVQNVEYCTISGKIPTEACRKDLCAQNGGLSCIAYGTCTKNDVPTEYCDAHVMVEWDKETGAICLDGCDCPEENLVEVGLRKIDIHDRLLKGLVSVVDAQYIYIEVPDGYVYPEDPDVPFFQSLLPEGYNVGVSVTTKPANRVCLEHFEGNDEDDENDENDESQDENSTDESENGEDEE
ncbi:MAG: transglycosylase domain-containing protein [Clostridia bacterium]|nr:transglycosylase domain-containing protein [Clostridia bacterium]